MIRPRDVDRPCRLSFAQERLWFLDQYEPGSPLYNVPFASHIEGPLDIAALRRTLDEIVVRHEVLRTTFRDGGEYPVQVVQPATRFELPEHDLTAFDSVARQEESHRLLGQLARRPFDLSRDRMIRADLLRLDRQEYILLLVTHHIATDGWSTGILDSEIHQLYNAYSSGETPELPALALQYADYAQWQREWLTGETLDRHLAYWEPRLANCPSVLQLSTDRPRPPVQTFKGASETFDLGEELSAAVRRLAQSQRTTLYMTLLAVFQTLLYRYTGQTAILVASPIAGRLHEEIEGLIGFFVNTLVQRADFRDGQTFAELLSDVRRTAIESYEYQALPFEKLVDAIQPERDLSHSPLVQVMFVFQNTPAATSKFRGLQVRGLAVGTGTAKFELLLSMNARRETLRGKFEYNSDLFDTGTIRRLIGHFRNLLASATRDPGQEVARLPLLSETERESVLVRWNDTDAGYEQACLHTLFERQAEKTPDAVALEFEGRTLTYRELDGQADAIARRLRQAGVVAGTPVGILLERSFDAVAAVLGVLKAGAAYVPLDAGQPPDRLAFLVDDAGVEHLIATSGLPLLPRVRHTLLLDTPPAAEAEPVPAPEVSLDDLLYVIYTSGSTGRPKGVAMTHRPLVNLLEWQTRALRGGAGLRVAQLAPLSFDVSCQEIFSTLTAGGTLVIVPEGLRRDPESLWRFLVKERIERLYVPFVGLEQLAEAATPGEATSLAEIITAGEQLRITPGSGDCSRRFKVAGSATNTDPRRRTLSRRIHSRARRRRGRSCRPSDGRSPIRRPMCSTPCGSPCRWAFPANCISAAIVWRAAISGGGNLPTSGLSRIHLTPIGLRGSTGPGTWCAPCRTARCCFWGVTTIR